MYGASPRNADVCACSLLPMAHEHQNGISVANALTDKLASRTWSSPYLHWASCIGGVLGRLRGSRTSKRDPYGIWWRCIIQNLYLVSFAKGSGKALPQTCIALGLLQYTRKWAIIISDMRSDSSPWAALMRNKTNTKLATKADAWFIKRCKWTSQAYLPGQNSILNRVNLLSWPLQ